jgi:endogenous inhibitor of DNA gyrase (YacG/DUF329 family)
MRVADEPIPLAPRRRGPAGCPICGRPADAQHRPFCSKRCREVDLARWFTGAYRIETEERDDPGGEPA